jgi:hypothetical protein
MSPVESDTGCFAMPVGVPTPIRGEKRSPMKSLNALGM